MSALAQLKAATARASRDRHQAKFRQLWRVVSPSLSIGEEVTFTNRRWRLDFGHLKTDPMRVARILQLRARGFIIRDIAKQVGVGKSTIVEILNGREKGAK